MASCQTLVKMNDPSRNLKIRIRYGGTSISETNDDLRIEFKVRLDEKRYLERYSIEEISDFFPFPDQLFFLLFRSRIFHDIKENPTNLLSFTLAEKPFLSLHYNLEDLQSTTTWTRKEPGTERKKKVPYLEHWFKYHTNFEGSLQIPLRHVIQPPSHPLERVNSSSSTDGRMTPPLVIPSKETSSDKGYLMNSPPTYSRKVDGMYTEDPIDKPSAMEWIFQNCTQYVSGPLRSRLSEYFGIADWQVGRWFQNRRRKSPRKLPNQPNIKVQNELNSIVKPFLGK